MFFFFFNLILKEKSNMCNNSNLNFSSSETHNQMQQYKQFKMLALNHPSNCLASCTVYLTLNIKKMSKCIITKYF